MIEQIEEVIGYLEVHRELLGVADGVKPLAFIQRMTTEEMLMILCFIRLRYMLEEEHEETL